MRKYLYFLLVLVLLHVTVRAQVMTDIISSEIIIDQEKDYWKLKAELPELKNFPGGRMPYYTYLWDFGDGHFSTEESPVHIYSEVGEYEIKLYATNNYDMGTKPPRPVKKIITNTYASGLVSNDEKRFFSSNDVFQLKKNADALPGSDLVIIAGVKPSQNKGTIYILTNENIYNNPGFILEQQSQYYNEQIIQVPHKSELYRQPEFASISSLNITQSGSPDYGKIDSFYFKGSEASQYFKELCNSYHSITAYKVSGEEADIQFNFMKLQVTPEMIQDTNAIITITGIYVPDNSLQAYIHKLDIPIVASHDPNKMTLKQTRLNYRKLFKKKRLTYKVQFQNDGEGDAKNIRLEMQLPDQADLSSFELLNLYPHCPPCDASIQTACYYIEEKEDSRLDFYFKGISLPGSQAQDNIDLDSTKGFVRFNVNTYRSLPNKPLVAQTNIFFDKNEPIPTNQVTAKFSRSLSPLIFAGYDFLFLNKDEQQQDVAFKNSWTAGLGLAPLAPYRKFYWQTELFLSVHGLSKSDAVADTSEIEIDRMWYTYYRYDRLSEERYVSINLTPLHLRYNVNSFISLGAGVSAKMDINLSSKESIVYHVFSLGAPGETLPPIVKRDSRNEVIPVRLLPFIDLNIGKAYLGPSFGLRFNKGINSRNNVSTYLLWRF